MAQGWDPCWRLFSESMSYKSLSAPTEIFASVNQVESPNMMVTMILKTPRHF